jgi:hypothetical protein
VRFQTRKVRFRSGAELLVEWGMPTNGAHYKRLVDAFRRVFGSTIFFGTSKEKSKAEVWHCSRTHFFDSTKLWLSDSGKKLGGRDNTVTLSHSFWQELQDIRSQSMLKWFACWRVIPAVWTFTLGSLGVAIRQKAWRGFRFLAAMVLRISSAFRSILASANFENALTVG